MKAYAIDAALERTLIPGWSDRSGQDCGKETDPSLTIRGIKYLPLALHRFDGANDDRADC